MTIELSRRLFEGGVIPAADLEAALLDAVRQRVPFLRALVERCSLGEALVDCELMRATAPRLEVIVPDRDLYALLPPGICEQLFAVPLGRDPVTDEVTVAVADPFDPHLPDELGHHLGAPVAIVPVPRRALVGALAELATPVEAGPDTAAYADFPPEGTLPGMPVAPAVLGAAPGRLRLALPEPSSSPPSEPPIPLVRRSIFPRLESESRPAGDPGAPLAAGVTSDDEPVLALARSKVPPSLPPLEPALEALEWAAKPDEVVDQVLAALAPFAGEVVVFAEQGGAHVVRALSASLRGVPAPRAVRQAARADCVLDRAIAEGRYLGPLEPLAANAELSALLKTPVGEVYGVPILVSGRPTLVVVLAALTATGPATRRADDLARAAGAALERIVLARKGR